MDHEIGESSVQDLDVKQLAASVAEIGFACTRCGHCCTAEPEQPHTAVIFPDEIRAIDGAWDDIARPMPYGLNEDGTGTTLEWALQVDENGDCVFYDETDGCTIYDSRPLICQSYPFQVDPDDGTLTTGTCQGLGEPIDETTATEIATTLKERAIKERKEARAVQAQYAPIDVDGTVVFDSEGPKRPDGTPIKSNEE